MVNTIQPSHTLVRAHVPARESRLEEAHGLVGTHRLVRDFELVRAYMLAQESWSESWVARDFRLALEFRLREAHGLVGADRLVRDFELLRSYMLVQESWVARESGHASTRIWASTRSITGMSLYLSKSSLCDHPSFLLGCCMLRLIFRNRSHSRSDQ